MSSSRRVIYFGDLRASSMVHRTRQWERLWICWNNCANRQCFNKILHHNVKLGALVTTELGLRDFRDAWTWNDVIDLHFWGISMSMSLTLTLFKFSVLNSVQVLSTLLIIRLIDYSLDIWLMINFICSDWSNMFGSTFEIISYQSQIVKRSKPFTWPLYLGKDHSFQVDYSLDHKGLKEKPDTRVPKKKKAGHQIFLIQNMTTPSYEQYKFIKVSL